MTSFKTETSISVSKVKDFVYSAKKESFAGSALKVTMPDQSSVYSYRGFDQKRYEGMIYTDQYNGNTVESGCETVSIDLCSIWKNQYYGGSYRQFWSGDKVNRLNIKTNKIITYLPFITIEFLKQALLNLPEEFPVRGPRYFCSEEVTYDGEKYCGIWEYENVWQSIDSYEIKDPFTSFQGKEIIKCNGETIYWHAYHGGFLRDKYFPINLIP